MAEDDRTDLDGRKQLVRQKKSHAMAQTKHGSKHEITEAITIHKDHKGHEDRAKPKALEILFLIRSSVFVIFVVFTYCDIRFPLLFAARFAKGSGQQVG
jgi:hypothetical protein